MSDDATSSAWSADTPPEPPPPLRNDPIELEWSPTAAIDFGWRMMKARPETILVVFVAALCGSALSGVGTAVEVLHGPPSASAVLRFAGAFVQLYFGMTSTRYCIKVARGEPTGVNELFAGGPYLNVLVCGLLTGICVIFGLVLLIVPAFVVAFGLGQGGSIVIDRGLGAVEAMRESWRITNGKKWGLFAFWLLSALVVLAGLLACCVGVIFSATIVSLAGAYTYVRLSGQRCVRIEGS